MSKLLGRWMRAHGQLNSEMPLRQYFLLVGGALLMLLFGALLWLFMSSWQTPRDMRALTAETERSRVKLSLADSVENQWRDREDQGSNTRQITRGT